jgi:F-type H+-transporting ATPase subunit epsilon
MARGLFHVSIITPERAVLEADASFVAFPAWDGEVGILHGRAPHLFKLGTGRLRAETPEGEQVFYVDGGFAQMVGDRLTILTQQAKRKDEIDRAAAERALAAARETPAPNEEAVAARLKAIERARAQIRVAAG